MVRISVLGDALKTILNVEKAGQRKFLICILMKKGNHIGDLEINDDRRGGKFFKAILSLYIKLLFISLILSICLS